MTTKLKGNGEGGKNVAVPGTPVQLVAVKTLCGEVVITPRPGNLGVVAIGFSAAVRATPGAEVGATIRAGGGTTISVNDVSRIWIDASVAGEGVSFTYQMVPDRGIGG